MLMTFFYHSPCNFVLFISPSSLQPKSYICVYNVDWRGEGPFWQVHNKLSSLSRDYINITANFILFNIRLELAFLYKDLKLCFVKISISSLLPFSFDIYTLYIKNQVMVIKGTVSLDGF